MNARILAIYFIENVWPTLRHMRSLAANAKPTDADFDHWYESYTASVNALSTEKSK